MLNAEAHCSQDFHTREGLHSGSDRGQQFDADADADADVNADAEC